MTHMKKRTGEVLRETKEKIEILAELLGKLGHPALAADLDEMQHKLDDIEQWLIRSDDLI